MLRVTAPVSITGPHGRIWNTRPEPGISGLVAVLQAPASKVSEAVRGPDIAAAALDSRADILVTADARGKVYVYYLRQNRYSCLDKVGVSGTAALAHTQRQVFVAFSDSTIRCYDPSRGTAVGVLREHRSPVRHMEVNQELGELLSTSIDGILVWDLKKLRRKRVLGSGPYGALRACYTPDGQALVSQFKDGSFYIWSASNFALVRSFTLPVAPPLRPLQSTFTLSPNGQLLVACGPSLPLLLVYSVISGELLHGVALPGKASQLDASIAAGRVPDGGTGVGVNEHIKAAEVAADAAAAAEAEAGALPLPKPGATGMAAALAASLPMGTGAPQVQFLPDSATVAVLLTSGSVAFVNVVECRYVGVVPYQEHNRRDCHFSVDQRANHMALTSNGKVFLYDLAATRMSIDPPQALKRIEPGQLSELSAAISMEHMKIQERQQPHMPGHDEGLSIQGQAHSAAVSAASAAPDTRPVADVDRQDGASFRAASNTRKEPLAIANGGHLAAISGADGGRGGRKPRMHIRPAELQATVGDALAKTQPFTVAVTTHAGQPQLDMGAVSLNRARLTALLEAFGEYPSKYRLLIWDFLLQLPHNTAAFASLVGLGVHPAFAELESKLPLASRALVQRMVATLSQLAHWCPVFAESSFLPDLVFPFVKLFASSSAAGTSSSAALDERCFEALATLLACGWMRGWFERFPHPPLGLLTRLQDLLSLHDAPLAAHLGAFRGGAAAVLWPHLATLWTELLPRNEWLRLWDHCITAGPDFLYHFVAAYLVTLRGPLLGLDTDHRLAQWLAGPPPVDIAKVLRTAYLLRNRTPEELRPVPSTWQPLPQGPTYNEFKDFPKGAVELFANDRARIRDAEEAIMRRRVVVSELELRTRAVALQTASLSTERQQLAALEKERRAALRQVEAEAAAEMARLDDRAKEEKLRQVAAVERAYQENLLEIRATWQRELESVRAEVAHKRALASQQLHSRQEDEQIKALEFHAQQRMWAMEEDVRRAALASAVRDELAAQQTDLEAKQRTKLKEWQAEEEARKLRLQHEGARRTELATAAEESAARNAAAREVMAMTLQVEDQMMKLEAERRLRTLAQDQALLTAEAVAAERARGEARSAAEQEALRLRAKADVAWYEAEQLRREQLMEAEKQQLEAAASAARQQLADTEAASRTMAAQAELLDRRRFLERQNAAQEAEVQRLVAAMASERARDASLVATLEAKEQEMKTRLEHAARVGTAQREVESREATASALLRAQLEDQQRAQLEALRARHAEAMDRLAREAGGQVSNAAEALRSELRDGQMAALRAATAGFERRKRELEMELAGKELAAGVAAGGTGQESAGGGVVATAGVTSQAVSGHTQRPQPQPITSAQQRQAALAALRAMHGVYTPTRSDASSDLLSESNMTPGSQDSSLGATTAAPSPAPPQYVPQRRQAEAPRNPQRGSLPQTVGARGVISLEGQHAAQVSALPPARALAPHHQEWRDGRQADVAAYGRVYGQATAVAVRGPAVPRPEALAHGATAERHDDPASRSPAPPLSDLSGTSSSPSTIASSFRAASAIRPAGRDPLDRSAGAATDAAAAMGRAALAAARAVSPPRAALGDGQHDAVDGSIRDSLRSLLESLAESSGLSPGSDGAPGWAERLLASGQGSSTMGLSARHEHQGALSSHGPASTLDSSGLNMASDLRSLSGPSVASQEPPSAARHQAPAASAISLPSGAASTYTLPSTVDPSARSDSRSSLQRSGLLGLSTHRVAADAAPVTRPPPDNRTTGSSKHPQTSSSASYSSFTSAPQRSATPQSEPQSTTPHNPAATPGPAPAAQAVPPHVPTGVLSSRSGAGRPTAASYTASPGSDTASLSMSRSSAGSSATAAAAAAPAGDLLAQLLARGSAAGRSGASGGPAAPNTAGHPGGWLHGQGGSGAADRPPQPTPGTISSRSVGTLTPHDHASGYLAGSSGASGSPGGITVSSYGVTDSSGRGAHGAAAGSVRNDGSSSGGARSSYLSGQSGNEGHSDSHGSGGIPPGEVSGSGPSRSPSSGPSGGPTVSTGTGTTLSSLTRSSAAAGPSTASSSGNSLPRRDPQGGDFMSGGVLGAVGLGAGLQGAAGASAMGAALSPGPGFRARPSADVTELLRRLRLAAEDEDGEGVGAEATELLRGQGPQRAVAGQSGVGSAAERHAAPSARAAAADPPVGFGSRVVSAGGSSEGGRDYGSERGSGLGGGGAGSWKTRLPAAAASPVRQPSPPRAARTAAQAAGASPLSRSRSMTRSLSASSDSLRSSGAGLAGLGTAAVTPAAWEVSPLGTPDTESTAPSPGGGDGGGMDLAAALRRLGLEASPDPGATTDYSGPSSLLMSGTLTATDAGTEADLTATGARTVGARSTLGAVSPWDDASSSARWE